MLAGLRGTDGSVLGNPGRAGRVLRNDYGHWIRGFSQFIGTTNSLEAEFWAIREGLVMARNLGIESMAQLNRYLLTAQPMTSLKRVVYHSSDRNSEMLKHDA
ncbi:hypothetical protein CRG98_009756 [Punica granatum]|uniref:RNase H type-1 domain-containing protein n=1 Tax=Punica granatum TaxID=22663 RepID=A0A2I0KN15_PUNGR|nr:hypothetical protein CRG98_009756 [Punica granatum]